MYATREGVKCIWSNENCPYDWSPSDEITYEAEDGHNVSIIPWEEFSRLSDESQKRVY